MSHLISPYQGALIDLLLPGEEAEQLKLESEAFPAIVLSQRQQCDLEMLLNGALSPLTGFMTEDVYDSVVDKICLPNGVIWPIPFCLDVSEQFADVEMGTQLALRDTEGFMPAVLTVESVWRVDKEKEALAIYGTSDQRHPGVRYLFESVGTYYVRGRVRGVQLPFHYDFELLRNTPAALRQKFDKLGWRNIVAFHTSKPMHRVHQEITTLAANEANAHILLHPVVGMSKPGDIHYYSRVHCYQAIMKYYPRGMIELSLYPAALRMAGPREALMNAIIRQNYGCSHYIVGTEHAAPPNVRDDAVRFYPTGASQQYVKKYEYALDIKMVYASELCFDERAAQFVPIVETKQADCEAVKYSNDRIIDAVSRSIEIPAWVTYPEVLTAMQQACPPRNKQGITLFFTGLSGSGKSTLARIVYARFLEAGGRPVTLLDGDVVRHNLSSELGFSKKDRDINVKRIGYVASEITKNRGVAICAPIAPYAKMRRDVRANIEQYGAFIEIYVSTSLDECERRDRKGLYAKARKGLIPEFTGISDPYEVPEKPELIINTENISPIQAAEDIYLYLVREGYVNTSV